MAASHRRTSSREPLVSEDPEVPASTGEDEPELLEIYAKTAEPPTIILDLSGPLHGGDEAHPQQHASASTSNASSAAANPPAPPSAFDKRLPKFLCCGCVCCLLIAILLVLLVRLAASNFEEEFSLTMEHSPPSPPQALRFS